MSKAKKNLLAIIVIIILALVAIDLIGGNYLVTFALSRSSASGADVAPDPVTTDETQKTARENRERLSKKTEIWLEQVDREVVGILSDDGLRLEGDIFSADPSSHRWLIGVHGYTGNRKRRSCCMDSPFTLTRSGILMRYFVFWRARNGKGAEDPAGAGIFLWQTPECGGL